MKTKLSPRFWCALTLFSLIGQVAWVVENMYLNVFIYNMFRATPEDISNMVMASAIAATLTTVLVGALSDKIGRRKLFICGGYLLWGVSILAFSLIRVDPVAAMTTNATAVAISLVIILDCVMTFFGSSANDAAFNAWLTDSTDSTNRGAAEGINAMMPLVAILAVFGGFMFFNLEEADSWSWIFAIIGGIVIVIGILGFFLIRDPVITPSTDPYLRTVIYGFLPSTWRKNAELYLSMVLFTVFNISIQIFMPYLIIYYNKTLGMDDYVFIMAPAIVIASVVTALWGKVYDKKGFGFSSVIAVLWLIVGYIVLFFTRTTVPVFIGSLFMMCGYLAGAAVFGAKLRDLTPTGKAGMLQGVRICTQVLLPGVIGPFIGKLVLQNAETVKNDDGTESFLPNANIFLASLIVILLLSVVLILFIKTRKPRTRENLTTPFEAAGCTSWEEEYPRPQMKRDSHLPLLGEWSLSKKSGNRISPVGSIRVPFPPESRLSGVMQTLKKGEEWIYERDFTLPEGFAKAQTLLHFGAVDQIAEVILNGTSIGRHEGGYHPFTLDITNALKPGKNHLTVTVRDDLDHDHLWGKQCKKRGGMWYTPISGIWQAVWLESLPRNAIQSVKFTPTLSDITVEVQGGEQEKCLLVNTPNGVIEHRFSGTVTTLSIPMPHLWSPEDPYLYTCTLTSGEDRVESYFALRTVGVGKRADGKPVLTLNGQPYFFHGLLDQGYYPEGIYLPASPDGYRFDIAEMKKLGFNMLRKHIKLEPETFYYECDRLGMAVFQDMINNGGYSFLIDTALPTAGCKSGISHRASERRKRIFEESALATQKLLYSHPCVCYYTVFNEGWGQYKDADRVYDLLKQNDPTRIYDTTSGWFHTQRSDVRSEHIYFKPVKLTVGERPLVLSEFGGYSCKLPEHSFNLDKTYGYRFFTETSDFADALEALYRDEVLPAVKEGMSAAVLTQVSDVEDETNGLFTYDRCVLKVTKERMQQIAKALTEAAQ